MATGGRENSNPAYETFRKYSADLLTVIQDPEFLAWELYAENIVSAAVRDAANNTMHERYKRTSDLLAAVDSQIAVDPGMFDVFLSVLAKRSPMSDLCRRMKDTYGKSPFVVLCGQTLARRIRMVSPFFFINNWYTGVRGLDTKDF